MDLLEYQVKEWFEKIGIPVLPSQRIDHPTDLKRLKIRYPIVLKSQVHGVNGQKLVESGLQKQQLMRSQPHKVFSIYRFGVSCRKLC